MSIVSIQLKQMKHNRATRVSKHKTAYLSYLILYMISKKIVKLPNDTKFYLYNLITCVDNK